MYNNYYGLAFNPFDKQCLSEYVPHNPQGNPRLIDNIMTDAITLGSQMDKKRSIQKSFLQLLIISSLLVSFIKLYVYICKAVASAFIADFIALFQKTDIQSFEINLRKCAVLWRSVYSLSLH